MGQRASNSKTTARHETAEASGDAAASGSERGWVVWSTAGLTPQGRWRLHGATLRPHGRGVDARTALGRSDFAGVVIEDLASLLVNAADRQALIGITTLKVKVVACGEEFDLADALDHQLWVLLVTAATEETELQTH